MKIMNFVPPLALVGCLTACSAIGPIPRDRLAANMAPILEIEKRFNQVRYYTQTLSSLGWISEEKWEELKPHYDIYYVYYLASSIHLAKGEMKSYLAHVQMAEKELDVIEAILKDELAKGQERDSGRKREFSGSNL